MRGDLLAFATITGAPAAPKGSQEIFRSPQGHRVVKESSHRLAAFNTAMAYQLPLRRPKAGPWRRPCEVEIWCEFRRPKRTQFEYPIGRTSPGDIDKLERAVLDGLVKAGWIGDDCLVVATSTRKDWGPEDRVNVRLWEVR